VGAVERPGSGVEDPAGELQSIDAALGNIDGLSEIVKTRPSGNRFAGILRGGFVRVTGWPGREVGVG
jgi:hypothetical protein